MTAIRVLWAAKIFLSVCSQNYMEYKLEYCKGDMMMNGFLIVKVIVLPTCTLPTPYKAFIGYRVLLPFNTFPRKNAQWLLVFIFVIFIQKRLVNRVEDK